MKSQVTDLVAYMNEADFQSEFIIESYLRYIILRCLEVSVYEIIYNLFYLQNGG